MRTIRIKNNPKTKKNEDSVSSLWDKIKRSIMWLPEREEKEQDVRNLLEEIIKENFPTMVKEMDMQIQEIQSPSQDGCKEAHYKTHHN